MRCRTLAGFTLIEVLLYLAIFSFIASALFAFAWNISDLGVKDRSARAVASDARLASEQIAMLIRSAADIDRSASRFDDVDGKLVLEKKGGNGTVVIERTNGRITVRDSAAPDTAVALTGAHSSANSLSFTDMSPADRTAAYISFLLTLRGADASVTRAAYVFEMTLRSGSALRNTGL